MAWCLVNFTFTFACTEKFNKCGRY